MPRPLRLDHPGAWFHVTARGNERRAIYLDDADRTKFLALLARATDRFGAVWHAYCLMNNHYHLIAESVEGRLSEAMQFVNGSYGRYFNRRRERVGHLFQGRFKASLIEADSYLLEAVRYVELNPCRAGLVSSPEEWRWSSYRPRVTLVNVPVCLLTEYILNSFGKVGERRQRYVEFLRTRLPDCENPGSLGEDTILGSHGFLKKQAERARLRAAHRRVPSRQRYADRPSLAALFDGIESRRTRRAVAVDACLAHGYTMSAVADHLHIHYTTVSRWINSAESDNS